MAITIKPRIKRKAGQRAGMNRAKITAGATKLWLAVGPEKFTIRQLAKHLTKRADAAATAFIADLSKGGL